MNKILFILSLLLSLSIFNCFAQEADLTGQADLGNKYLHDFGIVKEGIELRHDFTLLNESQNVLNIKNINTSCGCTGSKADKKILQPGESTRLEVIFRTKGYSGAVKQFVYVNTDSADNPILRFTIKAEVVK